MGAPGHCRWERNTVHTPKGRSAVSDKTKRTFYPTIVLLGIYPNELKISSTQNLRVNVYSSFVHNRPNLEATKVSFRR